MGGKGQVTCRMSHVRHCDCIIVLEDGKTVEDGTYDEVTKEKARFYPSALRT